MDSEEDNESPDNAQDNAGIDNFQRLVKQSWLHFVIALLGIPVMMLAFMLGLISLGELHKNTALLKDMKPESYVVLYTDKIAAVKTRAKTQYQNYFNQMDASSIVSDSGKLNELYRLTVTSEDDYVHFIESYKQLNYELASRVKGSGEWFYYFNKSLEESILTAKKRRSEMSELLLKPTI